MASLSPNTSTSSGVMNEGEDVEAIKTEVAVDSGREMMLLQQISTRPKNFRQFWRGEWMEEHRVPIWHEELRRTRRMVSKEWVKTTILSIFWGTFLHVKQNLGSLVVWVVDFDGQAAPYDNEPAPAIVGPLVIEAAGRVIQSASPHVGFGVMPASFFHNDPIKVRNAIYDFDAWAAIIINPNATALLRQAIATGNSSYDPAGACQTIYVESRDLVAIDTYLVPELVAFHTSAISSVGSAWANQVIHNLTTTTIANIERAPQALSPAIGFTTINLRPFGPPTATPAVTVGLIYLIIVAFFSYAFFMPTHSHFVNELEGHRKIYFGHLIIWKYCSTMGAYFFMSLAYSLVSLAFQIPFSNPPASHVEVALHANAYGKASFVVYWMINFIGMCALGFACENVAMILGPPWTAFWLVFWVISNVCTAFYPIELAPAFYYYGYAWPLHNIVEASKTVLFDVNSRIGLHLGVLLAWWAVNTAFFPVAAWWLRQTTLKKRHKRDLFKHDKKRHGIGKPNPSGK